MSTLKQRIVDHLKIKGNYDPTVDDEQIDDLIEMTAFAKELFKQLKKEGAVLYYTTTSGSRLSKLNPMLNAFQMCKRDVFQIAAKLGINRADRMKLKILEIKDADSFDEMMNA